MPFRESTETIAGCKTHFMRGGSGAPLLFLHGANGAAHWLPFMETLSERYDVIVPEHPGYGTSEMPEWLDNIGDLAFFYLDVIDHFGLDKVNLIGQSIGGWIALELAVRNDTKLRTLIVNAPPGIRIPGLRKADIFLWSPEETVRNLFHDQSFAEKALAAAPTTDEGQMVVLKNRLTTAKLAWQPRFYDPDLEKWLHRIATPTLVTWGEHDKLIQKEYGPALAGMIPGATSETFEDCGHLPYVEKADEFAARVSSFIEESGR
jgi:pimeloyl-ACP methyl ester carboxylesterase